MRNQDEVTQLRDKVSKLTKSRKRLRDKLKTIRTNGTTNGAAVRGRKENDAPRSFETQDLMNKKKGAQSVNDYERIAKTAVAVTLALTQAS